MPSEAKEYNAVVWTADPSKPGTRVTIHARDAEEARRLLKEQFGEEVVFTAWNEENDKKVR